MKKHNILVISPTYNERENIDKFSNNILDLNFKVLIIDDNSPDGTANVISKKEGFQKNIFLISRKEKLGYGSAVIEGFNFGIDNNFDFIVQMDADLSHRKKDLIDMMKYIDKYDVIVGSRYIPGGGSKGWGLSLIHI